MARPNRAFRATRGHSRLSVGTSHERISAAKRFVFSKAAVHRKTAVADLVVASNVRRTKVAASPDMFRPWQSRGTSEYHIGPGLEALSSRGF